MNLGFPALERPARNVLTAGSHCAKIMPSRVERVAQFSARPAVSYIERSARSQRTGNVESARGLKNPADQRFGCSGLFPVSEGHKLIQNFLQSLEPPFLVGGCPCISPVHMRAVRFTDLGYFFTKFLDTF
jgi:hypothetical protein